MLAAMVRLKKPSELATVRAVLLGAIGGARDRASRIMADHAFDPARFRDNPGGPPTGFERFRLQAVEGAESQHSESQAADVTRAIEAAGGPPAVVDGLAVARVAGSLEQREDPNSRSSRLNRPRRNGRSPGS